MSAPETPVTDSQRLERIEAVLAHNQILLAQVLELVGGPKTLQASHVMFERTVRENDRKRRS